MQYYYVRNWRRFQHYKHRNPPWVKLHSEIFTSTDWVALADASKLLMMVCIVVAAKNGGRIPNDAAFLKRIAYLDKSPNLKPLIDCGFLSETLADASDSKQVRTNADPEYRVQSTENRDKKKKEDSMVANATATESRFDEFWKAYPRRRGSNPKTPAKQKFDKLTSNGTEAGQIILGATNYAAELRRDGKDRTQFVAQAVTWLNQSRFNDYQQTVEQNAEIRSGGLVEAGRKLLAKLEESRRVNGMGQEQGGISGTGDGTGNGDVRLLPQR